MTSIGRERAIHQRALRALLWLNLLLLSAGCATKRPKENPPAQRGWVGGQYRLAEKPRFYGTKGAIEAFPGAVADQKTGVLVAALSSNTPAALAGLREGDLILEINHEPVQRVKDFRRTIDRTEPGTTLPFKVYRDGRTEEYRVPVGRETYRHGGVLAIGFFAFPHTLDLVPNPEFSVVAAGFHRNSDRTELGSVEAVYRQSCDPKGYRATDEEWRAWLVVMLVSKHKVILSQENVVPPLAWPVIASRE